MFYSRKQRIDQRVGGAWSFRVSFVLALLAVSGLALVVSVSSSAVGSRSGFERAEAKGSKERVNDRKSARARSIAAPRANMGMAYLVPPPPSAVTVDRTDDAPGASSCTAAVNDCSLRGAVAFANLSPGTTINVPAGTYSLTVSGAGEGFSGNNSVGDLDIAGNNTSIVGAGAASTIIRQTSSGDRVIEVNPFLDGSFTTSISDVTISGGTETTGVGGGGIISGSVDNSLTLTSCVISGNSATGLGTFGGGGVSHAGGNLTINGCTFSSNFTSGSGGGVGYSAGDPFGRFPSTGTLTVSGSTFASNTANSFAAGGGALDLFDFNQSTSVYNVASSSFSSNRATNASGGGIIVESGGPLTVTTSSFASNSAGASGGAIHSSASAASVTYSRLVGNTVPAAINGLTLFRSSGLFTAEDNWWGINTGPGSNDFRSPSGTVFPTTFLKLRASASPNVICVGGTSSITGDIKQRNSGADLTTELNGLPAFPATFINSTPAFGSLSGVSTNFVDGQASATFNGSAAGTAMVDVVADNQAVTASIIEQTNTTTDPANQMLCEGATATFATTASGAGPFTFVWKKGATVLNNGDLGGRVTITSGGGSSTLSITNVQASDADTYTLESTGACSTAVQSATLSINSQTSATTPVDQTVCQGAMASFSTTASGTAPFTYQWKLDGSNIAGATNSSVAIDTTSMSFGSHTVDVVVGGTCGNVTKSASLTVQASTSATTPTDQTVCQGATASFATTASGTGPFTYQWKLDGSNIAGATNSSAAIDTTSLTVGGHTVDVVVSGACGSVTKSASLTVQANTSATTPANQSVCQGAMASFSTTASGTAPFTYQWKLDGSNIAGATNSSVAINTTSLSVGSHTVDVVIGGTCGSVTKSASLTVQAKPATTDPADTTVCLGGTAVFSTTASGTAPFSFVWKQGATVLTSGGLGGRATITSGSTTSTLTITNVQVGDFGAYSVETTGACGMATQTASLSVNSTPPGITLNGNAISLWPPNHSYHAIAVTDLVASASSCDGSVNLNSVVIDRVTSDETENGSGDGNTLNDILIGCDRKSVRLRAERNGSGDGRVYTIYFKATDSSGNSTTVTATVTVPKNQNGAAAVDSGPQYVVVNPTCP